MAYEDRPSAIPGVELLARSLQFHSPRLHLVVYSPIKAIRERLADVNSLIFTEYRDLAKCGWNAKPSILLRALEEYERVLWLDTDVIISGDMAQLVERFGQEVVVVGQEFRGGAGTGGQMRAKAFELEPRRCLPYRVNSGSLLVSRAHQSLIREWLDLLSFPAYRAAQSRPINERAPAFVGDQDALWALLSSARFAHLDVDYFRVGSDMIQHCGANGYHLVDRLRSDLETCAFVHMLGRYKPWTFEEVPSIRNHLTDYLHLVCFELSPFFEAARPYATALGSPEWLQRRTSLAKFLNWAFAGNVALRGLPLAAMSFSAELLGRRPKL